MIKIFKDIGLRITIETNLKKVIFLDVTLDLQTSSFKPFRKHIRPSFINNKSKNIRSVLYLDRFQYVVDRLLLC